MKMKKIKSRIGSKVEDLILIKVFNYGSSKMMRLSIGLVMIISKNVDLVSKIASNIHQEVL
jgi:hypothetical protein